MDTRIFRASPSAALGLALCLAATGAVAQRSAPATGVDDYPPALAERLARQHGLEQQAAAKLSSPRSDFIISRRRWSAGDTILVAFNGGTPALHAAIAQVATEWGRSANLKFDFGPPGRPRSRW